jgi:hypothetical protein
MCMSLGRYETLREAKAATRQYQIAKEPMTVYKVLWKRGSHYRSALQGFEYVRGYHYYQTGDPFSFAFHKVYANGMIEATVREGLHCYATKQGAQRHKGFGVIVEMIIPKGAKYFKRGYLIVSDQLIFPH